MQKTIRITALAALLSAAPFSAALADRAPSAQESAILSDVLLSEGYSSWGDIEWDDGRWQVDDAIAQNGERRDLELDSSFYIIDTDEDDDNGARG